MLTKELFNDKPELMTIKDAAKDTGITEPYLRKLAREGDIPAIRIGKRRWYIPKKLFVEWLFEKEGGHEQAKDL